MLLRLRMRRLIKCRPIFGSGFIMIRRSLLRFVRMIRIGMKLLSLVLFSSLLLLRILPAPLAVPGEIWGVLEPLAQLLSSCNCAR
ncbi:MAG: hypothetical protein [Microviridae sp.]|nr:MAG: hypothetical protein [Microviridae sp.]